jgi:sugar lactone lactonase YvrE
VTVRALLWRAVLLLAALAAAGCGPAPFALAALLGLGASGGRAAPRAGLSASVTDVSQVEDAAAGTTYATGATTVSFTLVSLAGQPAAVVVTFSTDGGATFPPGNAAEIASVSDGAVAGNTVVNLATSPAGVAHTLVWRTDAIGTSAPAEHVVLQIQPQGGSAGVSEPLRVDNTSPPAVAIDGVDGPAAGALDRFGQIRVRYRVTDREGAPASVVFRFRTSGPQPRTGTATVVAGASDALAQIDTRSGGERSFVWDSVTDGAGLAAEETVVLSAQAADSRGGPVVEGAPFLVLNQLPHCEVTLAERPLQFDVVPVETLLFRALPPAPTPAADTRVDIAVDFSLDGGASFATSGTLDAGGGSAVDAAAFAARPASFFAGRTIAFTSGANAGLARRIVTYDRARTEVVLDAPLTAPVVPGDGFSIANACTEASGLASEGTSALAASEGGTAHTFLWNSAADIGMVGAGGVIVRVTPTDRATGFRGNGGVPGGGGQSIPFAVENRVSATAYGGGVGAEALLSPEALAVGPTGDLFIADTGDSRILGIDGRTRAVAIAIGPTAVADAVGAVPLADGPFAAPAGLALAPDGVLFVSDRILGTIRAVNVSTATAIVGGLALAPRASRTLLTLLAEPTALALGPDGRLYFAETGAHCVRAFDPRARAPLVSVVAGVRGVAGFAGDGGPADEALLFAPRGIDVATDGTLLIADTRNDALRLVAPEPGPALYTLGDPIDSPRFLSLSGVAGGLLAFEITSPAPLTATVTLYRQLSGAELAASETGDLAQFTDGTSGPLFGSWAVGGTASLQGLAAGTLTLTVTSSGSGDIEMSSPALASSPFSPPNGFFSIALSGGQTLSGRVLRPASQVASQTLTISLTVFAPIASGTGPVGAPFAIAGGRVTGEVEVGAASPADGTVLVAQGGEIGTMVSGIPPAATSEPQSQSSAVPLLFARPRGVAALGGARAYVAATGEQAVWHVDLPASRFEVAAGELDGVSLSEAQARLLTPRADGRTVLEAILAVAPAFGGGQVFTIDRSGTAYYVDEKDSTIVRLELAPFFDPPVEDPFAGLGSYLDDGRLASVTALNDPFAVVATPDQGVFIVDTANGRIRRFAPVE